MLYKAKKKNWRELPENQWWTEGFYVYFKQNDNHCIYYEKDGFTLVCDIDVSTLCACTGRKDVNGNLIWENDIVSYLDTYSTDNGYAEASCIGKVVWDNETMSFQITERISAESYEVVDECCVIGNIFDNIELSE